MEEGFSANEARAQHRDRNGTDSFRLPWKDQGCLAGVVAPSPSDSRLPAECGTRRLIPGGSGGLFSRRGAECEDRRPDFVLGHAAADGGGASRIRISLASRFLERAGERGALKDRDGPGTTAPCCADRPQEVGHRPAEGPCRETRGDYRGRE